MCAGCVRAWMIDMVGLATAEVHRFDLTYTISQSDCTALGGVKCMFLLRILIRGCEMRFIHIGEGQNGKR